MKAIQTQYKGYQFRSRLEARYAVFFDALGIDWDYEKEGFELRKEGRYLPDFFVPAKPGPGCWIEIKGEFPTNGEYMKMRELCISSGCIGAIFYGAPGKHVPISFYPCGDASSGSHAPRSASVFDILEPGPSSYDALYDTIRTPALCSARANKTKFEHAIAAARSARFEFGRSGAA